MKENERNALGREKLPKEFYISGAASVTITIGALVVLLIHSTKAAEREYKDENFGFSPRVERMIDEVTDRTFVHITDEPDRFQDELEKGFKARNRLLEKSELEQVEIMEIVENNPRVFSKQDAVDIEMYYPIYKAVGDKFKIDWYLLWIMHQEESTVSRDPNAFNGSNSYAGAMQRNPYYYPESVVDLASKGLEKLASLPQRNPTDWREIAFAAWKINRDKEAAQEKGRSQPLLAALESYSRADHAYNRWEKYISLRPIFSS